MPEASAAIARAERMGRLAEHASSSVLETTRQLLANLYPIEVAPELADEAADLARRHGLRAYDAVHLASYQRVESPTSVLIAADGDLVRAARTLGHAVAVPGLTG